MKQKKRKLVAVLTLLVGLIGSQFSFSPARADYGIGGGAFFASGSTFPFISGVNSSVKTGFFVQNLGSTVAELELSDTGVPGVTLSPSQPEPFFLAPGASTNYYFKINVAEYVLPGDHDFIISLKQVNTPDPKPGETTYAPGISSSVRIKVSEANAKVSLFAINSLNKDPVKGLLELIYVTKKGDTTTLISKNDSELTQNVIAGKYRAHFKIEGLTEKTVKFRVNDGEHKKVYIKIKGVTFVAVAAKPVNGDPDSMELAKLTVAVRNNIERFEGPITFVVKTYLDGEFIDRTRISRLAELPIGITEQQTVYSPEDGFVPGVWSFKYILKTKEYTVVSAKIPTIDISKPIWERLVLIIFWLLVLGVIFWWFIIGRRRKDEEEEEVLLDPEPVSPAPRRSVAKRTAAKPVKKAVKKSVKKVAKPVAKKVAKPASKKVAKKSSKPAAKKTSESRKKK